MGKLGATVGLGSVGLGSVGLGLVGALAGCFRLDAAEKTACAGQGDCVDGYVCLSRVCVSAGSVDADVELLSESTTPLDTITNVTGSGIDDVSAGVSDGELLRWNGTTWSVEPFCSQCASEAFLWQSARDDVWAVDAEGRVAHRDASGWKLRSPEAPPRSISVVAGVAGRPDLGVWAVGDGGLVAHWNGTWTSFDSTTPKDLSAVWVAATDSGAEAWAVGEGGAIAHFDGQRWETQESASDQWLLGVWGSSADDVWAVGANGEILRYDGAVWQRHDSGTERWLLSVWGTSSHDVWAAGGVGGDGPNVATIVHFDGTGWVSVPADLDEAVAGIWGGNDHDVWFAGACGVMLHYQGGALPR